MTDILFRSITKEVSQHLSPFIKRNHMYQFGIGFNLQARKEIA
jgi:hypothetical protein